MPFSFFFFFVLSQLTWWERCLQLLNLVGILHAKSVQETTAADLKFGDAVLVLLDAHLLSVLAAGSNQETLDLMQLLRLFKSKKKNGAV
jgi:hypothetical protein